MFYVLFVCKCVLYYSHRVSTQLQLTNISYHKETNRFSATQEIPRILWHPKVHYRIQKCPPPVPILSHLYPVHTTTSYFLKIHLKINLQSTSGSPKSSLTLRSSSSSSSSSSSPYICHGVGPIDDPFPSHVSRSLFKGLP